MRAFLISFLLAVAWAVPCFAQDPPLVEPIPAVGPKAVANDHELRQKYIWSALGLNGAIHATWTNGLDQWRDTPSEWGADAAGYAKRWASEFGKSAVGDSTTYLVARLLHHDPSFARCECSGVAPRFGHAIRSPFTARTRDGTRVFSPATVTGRVVGHVVAATTWYPAPRSARDGLMHAGTSLISKIGMDLFREFRPRKLK